MATRQDIGASERAALWAAGPAKRADAKLRSFGRREGDATMCPRCDGDGVILCRGRFTIEPMKCPDCGGEGLDPNVQHGGK